MELLVIAATLITIAVYLGLGIIFARKTKILADHLPVMTGRLARVANAREFSAATVATTISLATVVMAFFELAPFLGPWLLWTVITTALGLVVVRLAARKILKRMEAYGSHRPTLHEFLGREYSSASLAKVGAACTALGFLGAFAVELTVGSRFLAYLVPSIPPFLLVITLALVSLGYTSAGGFRVVIVTDQIQMKAIWLLLGALSVFYLVHFATTGGVSINLAKIPNEMKDLSWRDGLGPFLVGIFIINVPTFLSDMSVWQRIAGSQDSRSVFAGLWRSVTGAAVTWTLFVLLACLVPTAAALVEGENPLLTLLHSIGGGLPALWIPVIFFSVLGLYGAMFSTASTQLIAVSHTVYSDLLRANQKEISDRASESSLEVRISRIIICAAAVIAMILVEALTAAGFSIADLVFAIYGAQLGLFPATALALLWKRGRLSYLGGWALAAIAIGFVSGWGTAGYGKYVGDSNLVFLAPAASLFISTLVLGLGVLIARPKAIAHTAAED